MSTVVYGFRGDYSPGGAIGKTLERQHAARRRRSARKAGLASGRRRRQLAWRRRGQAGQPGLELNYPLRQPGRSDFERRYEALWPRPETPQGAAQWERGRETVWEHLMACWRLVAARGQHCRTVKPQRAQALAKRDRPRCPRTIRRLNIKVEQLGYAVFSHWRAPAGRKDCLVVEWRLHRDLCSFDVTPPSGTENPALRAGGSPPFQRLTQPENDSSPPSSAADDLGAHAGAQRQITEREELEARVAFLELKQRMGWGVQPQIRADLRRCRAELQAIRDPGSHPAARPDSDARYSEPSC